MHECPIKTLRALIVGDDETVLLYLDSDSPPSNISSVVHIIDEVHFSTMELSFFYVGSISSPNSMKLHGQISDHSISIMIDSGASHNFIVGTLVEKLNLPIEITPLFELD